jgi:pimeloyl-ACP methyl ester carboxylesterase
MAGPDAGPVEIGGPWAHRMVAANGARFHVATLGGGPLVVLLHGFPQFWWAWRHQVVALAEAGYRAVAMDLRGYGGSDKPPRGYDPFTLCADVSGVIRSLGARDAAVVGHGLGGLVAWTLPVLQPAQVRRVAVISAPHPRRMRRAARDLKQLYAGRHIASFQLPLAPERHLTQDDGALVERLIAAWSAPGWPDAEAAARYRAAIQVTGVAHCAMEFYRWGVRSLPRPDGIRYARAMKAPVTVPVLQLHGAQDAAIHVRTADGSGAYVQASYRLQLMEQSGHFPHEEDPAGTTRALLDFLAEDEA